MRIIVFGANGRVGRQIVSLALAHGHTVTAFIHRHDLDQTDARLKAIHGDIHDSAAVSTAIKGHDAVISALGSWGTPTKDILTVAMQHIIPAMEQAGIQRIVSLTGSDARAPGDPKSIVRSFMRRLLMIIGHRILRDGEKHLDLLSISKLDWTVIRSPVMKQARDGNYLLTATPPLPWATISRVSVATSMLTLIETGDFSKQAPFIQPRRPS